MLGYLILNNGSKIMYKVIYGLYHVIYATMNVKHWPRSLVRISPHLVRLLLKSPIFIRPIFCTVQSVALCHLLQSAELFFSMLSTLVKSLDEMALLRVCVCFHTFLKVGEFNNADIMQMDSLNRKHIATKQMPPNMLSCL